MEQMGRAEKGSIVVLTQTPLRLPHHVTIQREDQTLLFLRVCVCVCSVPLSNTDH